MSKLSLSFRVRPSILLFGDSITEYGFGIEEVRFGWASLLSSLYSRRADVLNRGFSGYNTKVSTYVNTEKYCCREVGIKA